MIGPPRTAGTSGHRGGRGLPSRQPVGPRPWAATVPPGGLRVRPTTGQVLRQQRPGRNPVDIYHLLRPLLKQTVSYRYLRGGSVISPRHRLGGADRDGPAGRVHPSSRRCRSASTSTPGSTSSSRPDDQLLTYRLVQGDEQVIVEFAPRDPGRGAPVQQKLGFEPAAQYVQMTLAPALDAEEPDGPGPRETDERPDRGVVSRVQWVAPADDGDPSRVLRRARRPSRARRRPARAAAASPCSIPRRCSSVRRCPVGRV